MVELNQQITWVPEHVKDGSFGKWLANARDWSISRNRFWGSPIPVWQQRRSELPAHRRLRLDRRTRARLRRDRHRPAPADRRRPRRGRTPTTRPARRRCAASPRCSTAGSSRARCRSPRCTTRSRTGSGSRTTIPATSSSSTSARPAAGSTRCTCWRRRCSTGRRSPTASATASSSATTARRCRRACNNYPDPMAVFDSLRRRRDAVVPAVVVDPARQRLRRSPRRGCATRCATCCCRCGTRGTSWRCTPTPPDTAATCAPTRRTSLDRYMLAKTRDLVDDVTDAMDAYDLFGACAARAHVPRHADQLVHAAQPRAVLGGRPGRDRHAAHRARRRVPRRGAAAAADHRGDLRRADGGGPTTRRACTSPTGRRVDELPADAELVDGDGPGPRRVLGHAVGAQGPRRRVRLPLAARHGRRARRRAAARRSST